MNTKSKTRNCPLCKEEIDPEAIKCKHCGSSVAPEKAPHEGTCPYCKEEIDPEAIKCKHCKSNLTDEANFGSRKLPQSDSDFITLPPFSGGIVANKQRGCRDINKWHKFGNWTCSLTTEECCDSEYVCYEPIDGGKPMCGWRFTNCSTTPGHLECGYSKKTE